MNKQATGGRGRERGFTLVELSLALIVIGLIIGAVSIGKDLQRNATYQRLNAVFVQSWLNAYQNYYNRVGIVVGDDPDSPSSKVNDGGVALCGENLVAEIQQAGVTTPTGRGPGAETVFAYLDSNGNPQQAEICFFNGNWSIPDGTGKGNFVARLRNVMVLEGLTPDLARYLDSQIDGRADARYGQFRENNQAGSVEAASQSWSRNNRIDYDGNVTDQDEAQVGVVFAWYLMNP